MKKTIYNYYQNQATQHKKILDDDVVMIHKGKVTFMINKPAYICWYVYIRFEQQSNDVQYLNEKLQQH